MRGIPGSGKSTKARELAGGVGRIHSTDSYFVKDGRYCRNPDLLAFNHEKNFQAFVQDLRAGVPIVICDNTNSRYSEYERYIRAARNYGYVVMIVPMPHLDPEVAAQRTVQNGHNVPESAIRNMIQRWEATPLEYQIAV